MTLLTAEKSKAPQSDMQQYKAGIFFGSTSDAKIAQVVQSKLLESGFETELHFLSAHRNPTELLDQLKRDAFDFYVAGAGLAAHLPGVLASHTRRPVFGIPVDGAFGGLDALLSIVQMPAGVPVLATGVNSVDAVSGFMAHLKQDRAATNVAEPALQEIYLQYSQQLSEQSWFQKELERTHSLAAELGVEFSHGISAPVGSLVIACVDCEEKNAADWIAKYNGTQNAILVPVMNPEQKKNPHGALDLLARMNQGGVWVGVNNLRNGVIAANRLAQVGAQDVLLYRGSVKNIIRPAGAQGTLIFDYSDRYSVFDWGPMPDEIAGKGRALAIIADQIFSSLKVPHHSRGLSDGQPRHLRVTEVAVARPIKTESGWDYSFYREKPVDTLVPLEIIFRFGVPQGSSLPSRLRRSPEYMRSLGLSSVPQSGAKFSEPVIEFSTKLEDSDRYLSAKEAQDISGMTDGETESLRSTSRALALELRNLFESAGLDLWDGKFEFAFIKSPSSAERRFMLVDSIGPDELRLTFDGVQISKEILRQFYSGSDWLRAVGAAKEAADQGLTNDWRAYCATKLEQTPPQLSPDVRFIASNIYPVVANAIAAALGTALPFPGAWSAAEFVDKVREAGLA